MADRMNPEVARALHYWTLNPHKAAQFHAELAALDEQGLAPDRTPQAEAVRLWFAQEQERVRWMAREWERRAQLTPEQLEAQRVQAHDEARALSILVRAHVGQRPDAVGKTAAMFCASLDNEAGLLMQAIERERAARASGSDPGCGHPVCKGRADCMAPNIGSGGA